MGRLVVAEEKLKSVLNQTVPSEPVRVGLLLGKSIDSKDIIALAVPTPSLEELGASTESGKRGGSAAGDDLCEWWVLDFASQVRGLLPGGVELLGVSVTCPTPSLTLLLPRLAGLLRDLVAKTDTHEGRQLQPHLLLLHYCVTAKRFKCQRLDTAEKQAGFRPAELKFRDTLEPWVKVEAILSLHSHCYVPTHHSAKEGEEEVETDSSISMEDIRTGIAPVLELLRGATVTLRGQMVRSESDPLIKRGKKSQQQQPSSQEAVKAGLYLRHHGSVTSAPPTLLPGARRVELKGSLVVSAYVHWKSSCADAIKAVRQDACRTITARLQAMFEAMSQGGVVAEQLPVRVSVSLPTCRQFLLADYLLPQEDLQECCSRVGELVGEKPENIEVKPLEKLLLNDDYAEVTEQENQDVVDKREKLEPEGDYAQVWRTYTGFVGVLAAFGAVLLAITIWIAMQPT